MYMHVLQPSQKATAPLTAVISYSSYGLVAPEKCLPIEPRWISATCFEGAQGIRPKEHVNIGCV